MIQIRGLVKKQMVAGNLKRRPPTVVQFPTSPFTAR